VATQKNNQQMTTRLLSFLLLLCVNVFVHGQVDKGAELFQTLKRLDSTFFERCFNQCDLVYLEKAVHKDLIFFHDQGGMQNRQVFLERTKNNICGNADRKPIRKADVNSFEVYPLYNDGRLYGAIQAGVHYFYIREAGKADLLTSTARFTHVWLLENGEWLLKEVLSYAHREP
jgi:hypothetical protein